MDDNALQSNSIQLQQLIDQIQDIEASLAAPIPPSQILTTLRAKVAAFATLINQMRSHADTAPDISNQETALPPESEPADFRTIVMQHPQGIMVVDRDGIVRIANPAMESYFRRHGSLVGEHFGIPAPSGAILEINIVLENDDLGTAELHVTDIEWQGDAAYLVTLYDITTHKREEFALYEERDLLNQRAEESDKALHATSAELSWALRAKDEFMAMMSHELRTPLTVILFLTEVLLKDHRQRLDPHQREKLLTIAANGQRLLSLINSILELIYVDVDHIQLNRQYIAIEPLCTDCIAGIQQTAEQKGVASEIDLDERATTLHADPSRLKQILVSLLDNAVKFTPEGGKVGLRVSAEPEQHVIRFAVWDTGIGISDDAKPHLFKPFFQLDRRLGREYEGAGLGLAIAARFVELHGGSIAAESESEHGSTFTITLPWEPESTSAALADSDPPSCAPSDIRSTEAALLFISDGQQGIAQNTAQRLVELGYRVSILQHCNELIDTIRNTPPALILVDLRSPRDDCLDMIRRIRNTTTLARSTPIIVMTALVKPGDRERFLAAGVDEYFGKPVSMRQLQRVLERYQGKAPA